MNIAKDYAELVEKRKACQEDVDYDRNPIIKAMIELLTKDVDQTVQFISDECSDEQMIWLSEILDEIIEVTKSIKIIEACYRLVDKYPETAEKYNIKFFVESAAEYLE